MQGYNLLAVYNEDGSRLLLCRRKKEPYRGLLNLTGGKIEPGENGLDAAYRELWEETSIDREEIQLVHLMDFTYPLDRCYVEVYVGRLKRSVQVYGEENELVWQDLHQNYFDSSQYAGEGNIGHILMHVELRRQELLGL